MPDTEEAQETLVTVDQMMRQITWAIAAERERCAKIAESVSGAWEHCGAQIAATIRRAKS